jgi:hypothetical protein
MLHHTACSRFLSPNRSVQITGGDRTADCASDRRLPFKDRKLSSITGGSYTIFLKTAPDISDFAHQKRTGWDYDLATNSSAVSYHLRYYLGRGGVEYEPPVWYANDEGTRTIILKNK